MPRARRDTSPTHIVVVDTNILWDEDKAHPVTPSFDIFWTSNSKLMSMELAVPEIVINELKFQQVTSAIKCLKTIDDSIDKLSAICKSDYRRFIG